ncbi:MAG TPA: RtcB family protein [Candidatus Lokiarchaeia archaeon]|nr:RtcB family protein [Candidatus Lokiarchaeia archaeon]
MRKEFELVEIEPNIYEIPIGTKTTKYQGQIKNYDMIVPARVYASPQLLQKIKTDQTLDQLTNVACLPGTQKFALALSDAHQGYGFPIGGVAATLENEGAISPGGVGYDINCGVRLLRTNMKDTDVKPVMKDILNALFDNIPSGVGSSGTIGTITPKDLDDLLENGVNWAIERGYGWAEDASNCEENGCMTGKPNKVSGKAKSRGKSQIGSLGSGNHFLEVQRVAEIYDEKIAKVLGINEVNDVTVMIHTGSRGLGHQVCTDYLRVMEQAIQKYHISVPDRELAYVQGSTPEARDYYDAMACAANYAWSNRQMITHWVRESFNSIFHNPEEIGLELIYDVCHNILKKEEHVVDGKKMKLNVHRKGATRAFPAGHAKIPEKYKSIGQPVLIPGSMGTASYLCVGLKKAMELSFGSTAHGAGRALSREAAIRNFRGRTIANELAQRGILVKAQTDTVIAEEAPGAYKSIDQVVQVSHDLGIVKKIVKLVPMGVTKG